MQLPGPVQSTRISGTKRISSVLSKPQNNKQNSKNQVINLLFSATVSTEDERPLFLYCAGNTNLLWLQWAQGNGFANKSHCSINGKTVVDMAQPSLYKTNLNVAKEKRT